MQTNRWWQALLVVIVVAVASFVWRHNGRAASRDEGRPARQNEPALPVLVATALRRDVPIYLDGLGTVTAYYTANVRPQVAGRVERVLFVEGQNVHRGDVLAEIDLRPFVIALHQAQATLARDAAQLSANRRTLARYDQLRGRNYVSPQDYDNAVAAVEQYAAIVRVDSTQVDSARLQLDYARPKAPIDGVTGARLVDPGNLVAANDTTGLVVITQVDPIAVFFTLPQDDLSRVLERMHSGLLPVEIYARDGNTRLADGTLSLVDNQVTETTATIRLKAIAPNPSRRLWPQQFVKVRLLLDTRRNALVIPAASIQRGPQGTFVYIVGADDRVAVRPVRLDRIAGEDVLIASGLEAGDRVVTDGQARLRPGARVTPRDSADGQPVTNHRAATTSDAANMATDATALGSAP